MYIKRETESKAALCCKFDLFLQQPTLRRDTFMSLPKQMQFDIQIPSEGGKIPHLIMSADDRWLRVEVDHDRSHNRE